ncbi:AAA family ATPase [Acidaminococcus massiliensis]|uniref:AAA family ATPase n=1 Tax=Acidaminococcus massiliensis TaxID=1852375 RepID=UPI0022E42F3F|nr:ATP-binding protein [Acidaminococcus massiliensis]
MLCQFSVKNFRCLKDQVTLDMQAANVGEHKESVLADIDGERYLPLAVIYGPNGGGKSTVLDALFSLCSKVMGPVFSAQGNQMRMESYSARIEPFAFQPEMKKEPTEFEIFFRTDVYEYQYNVAIQNENIMFESLYHKKITGRQYRKVFIREQGQKIQLSGNLKKAQVNDISDTITLLSYLMITYGKNQTVEDVKKWFVHKINFLDYKLNTIELRMALPTVDAMKPRLLQMFQEMGLDIVDYRIEQTDEPGRIRIFTVHNVNDAQYELDLHKESSGTIKIFNSIPFIADALVNGKTLVVDELDAKLHPLLLQYIIRLFADPLVNRKRAQLIFTSQDIITMNSTNFRRDEIWFAAKNIDEETQLYSLAEFKDEKGNSVRNDASFSKQYMEGRFGADPFVQKLIQWEVA